MAWGGSTGQVAQQTQKRKKADSNAAEIARLRKKIKRGGMSMKRGQQRRRLELQIKKLEGGSSSKSKPKTTSKFKTPAQSYTAANKNKKVPKHRKNSKKSWLDRAWGR